VAASLKKKRSSLRARGLESSSIAIMDISPAFRDPF
jgi:hypothetical protein